MHAFLDFTKVAEGEGKRGREIRNGVLAGEPPWNGLLLSYCKLNRYFFSLCSFSASRAGQLQSPLVHRGSRGPCKLLSQSE